MTSISSFAAELKRRHVMRVALVYGAVGWIVTEVSATVVPALQIPEWWVSLITLLVILGLPIALVLAWAFDLTPDGVRRSPPVSSPSAGQSSSETAPQAAASVTKVGDPAVLALPFVDRSTTGDHQYLGDGITEELIHSLAKVEGIRVVSRTSAFALRTTAVDLRELGHTLGVSHVIEGSVRLTRTRVRVTVQLIEADSGYAVWAQTLDRTVNDIFDIQHEIAYALAVELRPALSPATVPATITGDPTPDFDAYVLYLRGRQKWNERTPAALWQALDHFARAVQRDADYAYAHAGIADCWCILVDHGIVAPADGVPQARVAADTAMRLAPDTAEAHTSGALVLQLEGKLDEAEAGFRNALVLSPGHEPARHRLGLLLAWLGRIDEARTEMMLAHRTDPLSPVIAASLGWVEYFAGNHDEAIAIERRVLTDHPGANTARVPLALALVQAGAAAEAVDVLRGGSADAALPISGLTAFALGSAGRTDQAAQMIHQLESGDAYVSPYALAQAWLGLGETGRVLQRLEAAAAERAPQLVSIRQDPAFAALRDEPRFRQVIDPS